MRNENTTQLNRPTVWTHVRVVCSACLFGKHADEKQTLDQLAWQYRQKRFPADNFAEWNNGHPLGLRTVHAYVLVYDMGNLETFQVSASSLPPIDLDNCRQFICSTAAR